MEINIVADYPQLSQTAARMVADALQQNPQMVLVVPTGNTPLGMFEALAALAEKGEVDFSQCKLVELDDYYGIPMDDERNLYQWMEDIFIRKVGIAPENVLRFNTEAADPDAEAVRMEAGLAAWGGIDLLVLGLGPNGHVGFNEPGSSFDSPTRVMELTPESIESNARYWGGKDAVPPKGMTLGMKTLGQARNTVLIVSGEHKSEILYRFLTETITPQMPASMLKKMANVTVLADKDAARRWNEMIEEVDLRR